MYKTISQLNQDELFELSDREEMTIEQLNEYFSATLFVDDDFFCNL